MSEGPRGHPPDVIKAYEALPEEDDPSFLDALSECLIEALIWKRRTLVDDTLQDRVDGIVITRCGKRITKTPQGSMASSGELFPSRVVAPSDGLVVEGVIPEAAVQVADEAVAEGA